MSKSLTKDFFDPTIEGTDKNLRQWKEYVIDYYEMFNKKIQLFILYNYILNIKKITDPLKGDLYEVTIRDPNSEYGIKCFLEAIRPVERIIAGYVQYLGIHYRELIKQEYEKTKPQ